MTQEVFTASGTFTPPAGVSSVDVLVVGGGGGGGGNSSGTTSGGGGGGGRVQWVTGVTVHPGVGVTVTVGAGGAASANSQGGDGGTSTFASTSPVSSAGGGGGGDGNQSSGGGLRNGRAGGGSGGGGGSTSSPAGTGGAAGSALGNTGGAGNATATTTARGSGGGGGAAAAGAAGNAGAGSVGGGGAGGAGSDQSAHVGTSVGVAGVFAGGGGGGYTGSTATFPGGGAGGAGGGGAGGRNNVSTTAAVAGTANTGGGGGGGAQNQQGAAGGSGVVIVVYTIPPPGVPTSVAVTDTGEDSLELSWGAPASGDVTSYDVRLDGGSPITGVTSPHAFTGLSPATSYDLEVRAVGPGGISSWVLVTASTLAPTPLGYYRVDLDVGSHSWSGSSEDTEAEAGIRLPMSLGWSMPDQVEFFPCQADQTQLQLQLLVEDPSELSDITTGTTVTMDMYVSADPDAAPWAHFSGIVTQLDGALLAPGVSGRFLATLYATDDTARLGSMFVGYGSDWPQESIEDRVERICTEAGLTADWVFLGIGREGALPARAAGKPVDVLSAIRDAIKDAADEDDSSAGGPYYGRLVFSYDPSSTTVTLRAIHRRVWGAELTPAAPLQLELDGELVNATGSWGKLPGPDGRSWVLVDGVTFGTPSGPPLVRNTSLVDGDPGTATTVDTLGESLLPDGSTQLQGWYTRSIRHQSWLDPDQVVLEAGVPAVHSDAPPLLAVPVVASPVTDIYELDSGVDYLAGTLTGARLVLPPGGRFYSELRLRPELLPGTETP